MDQIPLPQDAWERVAAQPAPSADRYNGVPLGMEAFIPLLLTRGGSERNLE